MKLMKWSGSPNPAGSKYVVRDKFIELVHETKPSIQKRSRDGIVTTLRSIVCQAKLKSEM